MAIGEFDGAATLPGESGTLLATPMYWFYEMGHAALNPSRAFADATKLFFKNPANPLAHTAYGKSMAATDGIVRALHPPLSQAGMGHRFHHRRRRARAGAHQHGLAAPVLPAAAFRARLRARAAPAAAEAADRRADVGPLRDAAARHGRNHAAQPRRLHHRVDRRAHGAARRRPLRSRRLHRLRHLHAARAWRRRARDRGVPAVGAGAGGRRADGGRQGPLRAAFDGADGRPDRHPHQPERRQQARGRTAASIGSAATSSPRCRSRIPASCATSIRASCSCTAS